MTESQVEERRPSRRTSHPRYQDPRAFAPGKRLQGNVPRRQGNFHWPQGFSVPCRPCVLRRLGYLPRRRTFLVRVRDSFLLVSSPESVARADMFLVVSLVRLDAAPFWFESEEIFLVAEPLSIGAEEICFVTSPIWLDAVLFWFACEVFPCVVSPKKLVSGEILLVASPLRMASTPMPSPRLRGAA